MNYQKITLNTVQSYLHTLLKHAEITEEEYNSIRPCSFKPARAHGLPKIHKVYDILPPFRPIVDTTGTPYYGIGKFLADPLNPLTQNDNWFKD